ncbi:MAG: AarF/ABC1/UbiB kinase family protein [Planctomycetes bacterium]|nr:AarF/ABC1/UbiB kinase family protein [Planctomycetota bacterium]
MKISQVLKAPRRTRRVSHIVRVCAGQGLGFFIAKLNIRQYLPSWARIPTPGEKSRPPDLPKRFARTLEELGPTFVKFGQTLSTRADVLPPEYIRELQRICHHVAPFPGKTSHKIIEDELGRPIKEVYESFSEEPIASGSIAQVHGAKLLDGEEVVVKVRRPGIEQIIEDDLAIMKFLAEQAYRLEEFEGLQLPMLVDEFAQGIRREQNLLTEAANTHKFHSAFKEDEKLVVPRVYWDFCSPGVLTIQRLEGTFLNELEGEAASSEGKSELARIILDRFLTQFFSLGAFHADPHTGNILIMDGGQIGLIDFGLVGKLGSTLRSHLSNFVIALGNQQLELAAEVIEEMGSVPTDINDEDFRSEVSELLERYYAIPFERIDLQRSFQEIMQVVRKYGIVMPRDFVLLGKSLVSIGGIVMQLDPEINAAELATPYARKLALGKLSPKSLKKSLTSSLYHLSMLMKSAPREIRRLLRKLREGGLEFSIDHRGLDRYLKDLDKTGNRLALSIMLAAIIISSTSIMTTELGPTINLLGWEASAPGLIGYLFGFLLGAWLVIGIFRSGRI